MQESVVVSTQVVSNGIAMQEVKDQGKTLYVPYTHLIDAANTKIITCGSFNCNKLSYNPTFTRVVKPQGKSYSKNYKVALYLLEAIKAYNDAGKRCLLAPSIMRDTSPHRLVDGNLTRSVSYSGALDALKILVELGFIYKIKGCGARVNHEDIFISYSVLPIIEEAAPVVLSPKKILSLAPAMCNVGVNKDREDKVVNKNAVTKLDVREMLSDAIDTLDELDLLYADIVDGKINASWEPIVLERFKDRIKEVIKDLTALTV